MTRSGTNTPDLLASFPMSQCRALSCALRYGEFPEPGWALIGAGESQALAAGDAAVPYGAIGHLVTSTHGRSGTPDEQGIHWGGYDRCSLVVPSLRSALIGKACLAAVFCGRRSLSSTGFGPLEHAANLMVCLACVTRKSHP